MCVAVGLTHLNFEPILSVVFASGYLLCTNINTLGPQRTLNYYAIRFLLHD